MMTLAELGEVLREERSRRGYTVDDVATSLKITSRVVRAIEDGDRSSLPHAVYACGFIKAYAAMMDVDETTVRESLSGLSDPHEESQPVMLVPPSRHHRNSGGFLPALTIVCALAFGVFWFRVPLADTANRLMAFIEEQTQPTQATPAAASDAGADFNEETEVSSQAQTSADAPSGTASAATEKNTVVRPAMAESVAPPSVSAFAPSPGALNADGLPANLDPATVNAMSGSPADSDTPRAETDAARSELSAVSPDTVADTTLTLHQDGENQTDVTRAGQGKHQIVLSALEECWVHSSADGTFTRQFSLKKGETFALSFESRLVVKLGNAGGVSIKYDGEAMPAPGKSGQVRTLTFPPTDRTSAARP